MRVKYLVDVEIRSDVGAHTFAMTLGEHLVADDAPNEIEYVHGVEAATRANRATRECASYEGPCTHPCHDAGIRPMTLDDMIATIKQAANMLYGLGYNDQLLGEDAREQMRRLSDELDQITRALGGNPFTPAWKLGGDQGTNLPIGPERATGAEDL